MKLQPGTQASSHSSVCAASVQPCMAFFRPGKASGVPAIGTTQTFLRMGRTSKGQKLWSQERGEQQGKERRKKKNHNKTSSIQGS